MSISYWNTPLDNHKCTLSRTKGGFSPVPTLNCKTMLENWFWSVTTISRHHPMTKFAFRSIKSIENEKKRHMESKYWYIIHPFSILSYYWMIIMMVVFAIAQPFDYINSLYCYNYKQLPNYILCILIVLDCFHISHIFMTFLTGYQKLTKEKQISMKGIDKFEVSIITLDPKKIAKRYLQSYFIVDLPCVLTLPLLIYKNRSGIHPVVEATIQSIRIFRMITVIKSCRILILNLRKTDVLVKILTYIISFLIILMFFGCYQLIIPRAIIHWSNSTRVTFTDHIDEIYRSLGKDIPNTRVSLIHSIQELTQNVFSPIVRIPKEVIEEKIIFVIISIIGVIGKLSIFVGIFKILSVAYFSDSRYQVFSEEIRLFLKSMDVLQPLYSEAEEYVDNLMEIKYFKESDVLNVLPDANKQSILFDNTLHFITECDLFMDVDYQQLISVTLKLKYELSLPGKRIIEIGDNLTCMYFIVSGTVAIYAEENIELYHKTDGFYFGEAALLPGDHLSEIEVIALERCNLYVLRKKYFDEIMHDDTRVYEHIRKIMNRRQRRQTRRITTALMESRSTKNRRSTRSY